LASSAISARIAGIGADAEELGAAGGIAGLPESRGHETLIGDREVAELGEPLIHLGRVLREDLGEEADGDGGLAVDVEVTLPALRS